jgi:hypothetical protein
LSETVKFADGGFALADSIAKGFHGYVAANLIAVFEAVNNRLGGGSDANRDAFENMFLDAFCQGLAGESNDAKGKFWYLWRPCLGVNGYPCFGGKLRCEFVKPKSG